jgi:hypothetical protein
MLNDASDFAEQYLRALTRLVAEDETMVAMLHWVAAKSKHLPSGVQPSAARTFGLFLALGRDLARDLARARARALDLDVTLSLALDLTRVPASTPALDLALALGRDLALDITRPRTHARIRDRAFARARALALALDVAVTYDLTLVDTMADNTAGIIEQLQRRSQRFALPVQVPLSRLRVPLEQADRPEWQAFAAELEQIILQHWGLDQFWQLSEGQVDLLTQYLHANHLLLECLEVAYVPERQAIVDQLLLPPG